MDAGCKGVVGGREELCGGVGRNVPGKSSCVQKWGEEETLGASSSVTNSEKRKKKLRQEIPHPAPWWSCSGVWEGEERGGERGMGEKVSREGVQE